MTIELQGIAFVKEGSAHYTPGRKAFFRLIINPGSTQQTAVDAGEGASIVSTTPVTSLSIVFTDTQTAYGASTPSSLPVDYGFVQPPFSDSGYRTIRAVVPAQGSDFDALAVVGWDTFGTVWSAPIEAATPADTASPGTGLLGRWFNNRDLVGTPVVETLGIPFLTATAGTVYPGGLPPAPLGSGATYSTRYTGRIKYPSSGGWRFRIESDDGFRLYVNGRLELDYWSDQNRTLRLTGTFTRSAGGLDTIWLEHYNKGGSGGDRGWMEFMWSLDGANFEQVPVTALYSTDGTELLPAAAVRPNQTRFLVEEVNRY